MYRGEPTQGAVWDEARATTYPRPGKRKQLHARDLGKRGAANTPPPPLQAVRTASSVPLIPIVIFSESRRRNPSTTARIRAHARRPPPHPRRAPASVSASTPAPAPGARHRARCPHPCPYPPPRPRRVPASTPGAPAAPGAAPASALDAERRDAAENEPRASDDVACNEHAARKARRTPHRQLKRTSALNGKLSRG